MKRRRALLLSLTIVLALCAICGGWVHRAQRQYALNRALIAALVRNDTKTALALVNAGADPNTRYDPPPAPSLKLLLNQLLHHISPPVNNSPTALIIACGIRQIQVSEGLFRVLTVDENPALLQTMLAHDANVDAQTRYKHTALYIAVGRGWRQVVELLVQHHANVNAQDEWGHTPLMSTTFNHDASIARLLLAQGANPNVQDEDGYTALFWAIRSRSKVSIFHELLAHGADPNLRAKSGISPLQRAQQQKRPDLVLLLKQHGAQ